jgi:hypothetical protein
MCRFEMQGNVLAMVTGIALSRNGLFVAGGALPHGPPNFTEQLSSS